MGLKKQENNEGNEREEGEQEEEEGEGVACNDIVSCDSPLAVLNK